MNDPEPPSKLISFKRKPREGTLEPKRAGYDACRHKYTIVDQEKRAVTCRDCETALDPFQVLWELAIKQRSVNDDLDAWQARQESLLSDRYDQVWLRHAGDITVPPDDPELRQVWDIFHAYFGDKFTGMFRRKQGKRNGIEWYGRSLHSSVVSLVYARSMLAPKLIPAITPAK